MGLKIFLGNSPWNKPGFYGVRAGSRWPHFEVVTTRYMPFPFQLAYAAAILEQDDFNVLLVDGIAEQISEEFFLEKLTQFKPDFILLEVSTPSFDHDIKFTRRLRKAVGTNPKIALCGPHAPMFETKFLELNTFIDLVLIGEYERTLDLAARALDQNEDLLMVPGLIYRDNMGQVVYTGSPRIYKDLDEIPWPARHFLPMHNYFDNPGNIPEPSLQMWASRGCPYSCSFCAWPQIMNSKRYRTRKIHSILDEIESECSTYHFRSFYFDDDTFNIGKQRMLNFCTAKNERGIDMPWAIMARADLMDLEILKAMSDANLTAVKYGIESAEPKLLKNVRKDLDLKKAVQNVLLTKQLGIKVHLTFMFGLPGENSDSIRKTIKLAKELNPESAQFSILTPLPGTLIYNELIKKGHLMEIDWSQFNGYYNAVIRTDELTSVDLERALKKAWKKWIRHKAISNLKWCDVAGILKSLPSYVRNPSASLNQLRRLMHV